MDQFENFLLSFAGNRYHYRIFKQNVDETTFVNTYSVSYCICFLNRANFDF